MGARAHVCTHACNTAGPPRHVRVFAPTCTRLHPQACTFTHACTKLGTHKYIHATHTHGHTHPARVLAHTPTFAHMHTCTHCAYGHAHLCTLMHGAQCIYTCTRAYSQPRHTLMGTHACTQVTLLGDPISSQSYLRSPQAPRSTLFGRPQHAGLPHSDALRTPGCLVTHTHTFSPTKPHHLGAREPLGTDPLMLGLFSPEGLCVGRREAAQGGTEVWGKEILPTPCPFSGLTKMWALCDSATRPFCLK